MTTRRARKSSSSSYLSSVPSAIDTARRKHHHKTHKETVYDDDNYSEPSVSNPINTDNDDDDDNDSYSEPESENNRPTQSIHKIRKNRCSDSASNSNYPVSYINVAPIPIFRGGSGECPITHLSRFLKMCRANNASSIEMMVKIFPVTLDNEALLWYDLNIEPYPSLTWDEIKSSFMESYSKTNLADGLRSELMMLNQGEEESVRSYFLRLQWVLKRWPDHGLSEGLINGVFVDGLREDFQNWVVPQKPSSLNDALRLAFNWEQVRCVRGVRRNASVCGFCSGSHQEGDCEIRERMRCLWLENKGRWSSSLVSETGEDAVEGKFSNAQSPSTFDAYD